VSSLQLLCLCALRLMNEGGAHVTRHEGFLFMGVVSFFW
jgi:hypothetical protein